MLIFWTILILAIIVLVYIGLRAFRTYREVRRLKQMVYPIKDRAEEKEHFDPAGDG